MRALSDAEMRSLVGLLDDEDAESLALVRRDILEVGERALTHLENLRVRSERRVRARAAWLMREVRFQVLRRDFLRLAAAPEPSLERGALLICRFDYPLMEPASYTGWLDRVAARVLDDLPSDADAPLTFQRLNSYVFRALGFSGNESRYYDPDNSYLHRVIESRRGIPISLSVLYLLLARRLRLPVFGVGTPGHFLVGFRPGPHACYLDAFNRGRILDLSEVRRMLVRSGYDFRQEFLTPCPPREILARMLRNLVSVYQRTGQVERAEMLGVLVGIVLTGRDPMAPRRQAASGRPSA